MDSLVILIPIYHRDKECIGIRFEAFPDFNTIVRSLPEVKWSQTHKCWYVPLNKASYNNICSSFKGKARINNDALQRHLLNKTNTTRYSAENLIAMMSLTSAIKSNTEVFAVTKRIGETAKIHDINAHVIPSMLEQLTLKAYSRSTIKTYVNEMTQFLQRLGKIPADELTPEHLRRYLVYCFEKLQLKENTVHSRINALKFYYEQVLRREKFFWQIPRPKQPVILPRLLNETELRNLFNALANKKHKAMLFTAYSAGLRVSEIANLKIADIDSKRMQIFIGRAKGKKDRYVNLRPD